MKRILVLGPTGFVGGRVLKALAATSWAQPLAGVRRDISFGPGVQTIHADATNAAEVLKAVESVNADAIVNCVLSDAEGIRRNAEAVLRAGDRFGLPVVFFSSMAVYGAATGVVREDEPLSPDAGWYSQAKAAAEAMASQSTAPVTIFRPGCIYGSGGKQWTGRIAALLRERRIGDLGPAGDGRANLVHIDDVIAATLATLHRPPTGVRVYNLAMSAPPTWNMYFRRFARALGAVPVPRISGRRLKVEAKLVGPLLYGWGKILRKLPPPIPSSLLRLWRQDIVLDAARATEELDMQWTSLEDGIAESLRADS